MAFDPLKLLGAINQTNPDLSKQVYTDLIQPSAKEIGEISQQILHGLGLLAAPFVLAGAWKDRFEQYAAKVAAGVPEERQVVASPLVAGPVIEKMRFIEEGSVYEEMFLNLMTAAIDRDRQADAHPSFATIIPAMAPDEAYLLFDLAQMKPIDETLAGEIINSTAPRTTLPRTGTKRFPDNATEIVLKEQIPVSRHLSKDVLYAYLDHLESLGLIEHREFKTIELDGDLLHVYACLTDFGVFFVKVCLPSKERVAQFRENKGK